MKVRTVSLACLLALAGGALAPAVLRAQPQTCQPPPLPPPAAPGQNIFTPQQEMDLGDAVAEHLQRNFRVIDDPEVADHLRRLGARLVAQLPETGLRIQFFLMDLPVANAYTLPGGRVYVARKLIALTHNEDELAGVLAHELGHVVSRQLAYDMTRRFREELSVTSVGDRRDIFDKYNRLVENSARGKGRSSGRVQHEQLEADQIGLYALARAGYDPQAQAAFWDRLAETKGDTGNWFSNLFGTTKPAAQRLREMLRNINALPAACRQTQPAASAADYRRWQAAVVGYAGLGRKEALHGVGAKLALAPPLRGDITHMRFSPDGKYVLAQDESGITVLVREPFALLFRIPAPDANPAQFTPDSQAVVFHNNALHVERWGISEQQRLAANELYVRAGCWQTALSPDGRILACYERSSDLTLLDVATGAQVFQKKSFYVPFLLYFLPQLANLGLGELEFTFLNFGFSPDARYFVAGGADATIALDLANNASPVQLRGPLKKLIAGGFTFIGPERVLGVNRDDFKKSGLVSFPAGAVLAEMPLGGEPSAATHGNYALLRPIEKYAVGVLNLDTKKIVMANKLAAFDVYDQFYVSERTNGELGIYRFDEDAPIAKVVLPLSDLGPLRAAAFAPDMRWLALSLRSRGAVLDLTTGERVLHVRGFRGAYFAPDGLLYADFPKYEETERTIARINPATREVAAGPKLEEGRATQYGPVIVSLKPAGKGDAGKESRLGENVVLDVRDVRTGAPLWSRPFPKEAPQFWLDPDEQTVVLAWATAADAARAEIDADPELRKQLGTMKEKEGDYFLQVLDARDGHVLGRLLVETGKGSFRIESAAAAGDWVVITDTRNRVLIYALKSGARQGEVFGERATVARAAGLLAVENEPGRLSIYDLTTMAKRDEFSFTSPVALARFSPDGRRLFVLTANQTAYVLKSVTEKD